MLVAYRQWSRISAWAGPEGWVRGISAHKVVSLVRRGVSEGVLAPARQSPGADGGAAHR
jgi:hypothetical protein